MAIKQKQINGLGDPQPRAANWGISLFAVFCVLMVMLWGSLAATGLRYARLQDQFARLAGKGKHLHRILDDERFQPILEQHRDSLRTLLPVVSFIDKGNLARALQLLDSPGTPRHPLLTRLRDRIAELADADSEYQEVHDEQSGSKELKEALLKSYVELHSAASQALLGDQALPEPRSFKKGFYREGLLSGLPLMEGIPDGIATPEKLEIYARKYHEANWRERKVIEKNLEGWRVRGQTVRPQIEELQEKREGRSKKLKQLFESRRTNRKKAELVLTQVAQEFTRMVLAPSLIVTYERFQTLSRAWGIRAPELKTT